MPAPVPVIVVVGAAAVAVVVGWISEAEVGVVVLGWIYLLTGLPVTSQAQMQEGDLALVAGSVDLYRCCHMLEVRHIDNRRSLQDQAELGVSKLAGRQGSMGGRQPAAGIEEERTSATTGDLWTHCCTMVYASGTLVADLG